MRFSLAIISLSLALLLIGSLLATTNMQTLAQTTYNNNNSLLLQTNNNDNILNVGSPQKESFPPNSQSPILISDQKKGGLDIGHPHNPPLPSSGEPIKGPIRGTQTSP